MREKGEPETVDGDSTAPRLIVGIVSQRGNPFRKQVATAAQYVVARCVAVEVLRDPSWDWGRRGVGFGRPLVSRSHRAALWTAQVQREETAGAGERGAPRRYQ